MKKLFAVLAILAMLFCFSPAMAQTYDNGPVIENGGCWGGGCKMFQANGMNYWSNGKVISMRSGGFQYMSHTPQMFYGPILYTQEVFIGPPGSLSFCMQKQGTYQEYVGNGIRLLQKSFQIQRSFNMQSGPRYNGYIN